MSSFLLREWHIFTWGLDLCKLGLCFGMCRGTVLISEHFLGEEAKILCRRLDLNAWVYPELLLRSWFYGERCPSLHFHGLISFFHVCLSGFSGGWLIWYKIPSKPWYWGDTQQEEVVAADQHKGGQKPNMCYLTMAYCDF